MNVSLVIPARNAQETIEHCLDAVAPLLEQGLLREIIVVDDGSTDRTRELVGSFPGVTCLRGPGAGPGGARNLGWRAARGEFIWFVDSDCVAEPGALDYLVEHMQDPDVAGVSGSYGNMREDSILACLIHEEIVARHAAMPRVVDFLATFNVLYRRDALEQVGGFDPRFLKAQDAELSFRIREQCGRLEFDIRSRVKHFHEDSLMKYLRVQHDQGFWRMFLYARHPDRISGDSYSGFSDHVQPPLAVLSLVLLPLGPLALGTIPVLATLGAAQLPMTLRILQRTRKPNHLLFGPMSFVRSYARGVGLVRGATSVARERLERLVSGPG